MENLEGIELKETKPFADCGLIFWTDGTPSQEISFTDEQKLKETLSDIIAGKGIEVRYDFATKIKRVFPYRVIVTNYTNEFAITQQDFPKGTVGQNEHQPTLVK